MLWECLTKFACVFRFLCNCQLVEYGNSPDNEGKPVAYTGEIRFYSQASEIGKKEAFKESGWLECSAYFVSGKLLSMNLIQYREAVK